MPKAPYGKVCRRDVRAIRNVLRTKMKEWAREWAEKSIDYKKGSKFPAWRAFLAAKLRAEIRGIGITCD